MQASPLPLSELDSIRCGEISYDTGVPENRVSPEKPDDNAASRHYGLT